VAGALTIRTATPADAGAVAAIYASYVRETAITFEVVPPDATEMARRMEDVQSRFPWLIAERDGELVGYAYASPFHKRPAYRWVAEATVYVAEAHHRAGIGRALYTRLLDRLRDQRMLSVTALIALPNDGSIALHEMFGFVHAGTWKRVGFKLGRWHDVGIWQCDFGPRPASPPEPLPPVTG